MYNGAAQCQGASGRACSGSDARKRRWKLAPSGSRTRMAAPPGEPGGGSGATAAAAAALRAAAAAAASSALRAVASSSALERS
jgi:hypothetical protein